MLTLSDSQGYVYEKDGFTREQLDQARRTKGLCCGATQLARSPRCRPRAARLDARAPAHSSFIRVRPAHQPSLHPFCSALYCPAQQIMEMKRVTPDARLKDYKSDTAV